MNDQKTHVPDKKKPRRSLRKRMINLTAILLILLACYFTIIGCVQRSIIYPSWIIPDTAHIPPAAFVEADQLETDQGPIDVWFIPGEGVSAEQPGPAVVFAHGNGELIDMWQYELAGYRERGVSVLLVEYRGYGRSAGKPTQARLTDDFSRAYDAMVERPEVDGERIIFHGRSIGGGVVSSLATQREPAALILQSTFTDIPTVARRYLVPRFMVWDKYDVRSVVKDLGRPILIFHGRQDDIIPLSHGEALHKAAPDSELLLFDVDHNNPMPQAEYWQAIEDFLVKHGVLKPQMHADERE